MLNVGSYVYKFLMKYEIKKKPNLSLYYFFNYQVEKAKKEEEVVDSTFDKLNLDARLIENLKKLGLYKPTIIQKHGIPEIANGQNIAIAAETGCGKTFTYLLPIIDQILKWKPMITERPKNSPIALVITPSRELALQIAVSNSIIIN